MIRMTLLGPEGAMRRAEELQRRVAQVNGEAFSLPSTVKTSGSSPIGLTGPLTGSLPGPNGFAPFSPFGQGEVTGIAPPMIKQLIAQAARQNGVDEDLFDALVATESGYDPKARSRSGAMGLAQLMPETAASLGVTDAFDPAQNLNGGAKYLAKMLEQFGDARLALAAYNAGPGRVIKAGNQVPNIPETQRYVEKIMALLEAKRR
jgi:Transglycosylase SLT domain